MVDDGDHNDWPLKAYRNPDFLSSPDARTLRVLSEYLEPEARFDQYNISDTIVFFGSARTHPRDKAEAALEAVRRHGDEHQIARLELNLEMARYYEESRALAHRLTEWSKGLEEGRRRFVVCTGGGPGIMEAANRGASEAKGLNIGLNISLPHEQHDNPYISRELNFEFHYFFTRKFWFIYLAKALVVFPGGFGTLDEFFELMTLLQTGKLGKKVPIILYGTKYWDEVINFDAMVKYGTISAEDLNLFHKSNDVDDAFNHITAALSVEAIKTPGGGL